MEKTKDTGSTWREKTMFGRVHEEGFSGAPSVLFLDQGSNYMVLILL